MSIKVSILKFNKTFNATHGQNLMKLLVENNIPVASSCKGEGVCGKCHIKIIKGTDNLSEESILEKKLKTNNGVPLENRISCQTLIFGDLTIDANYW